MTVGEGKSEKESSEEEDTTAPALTQTSVVMMTHLKCLTLTNLRKHTRSSVALLMGWNSNDVPGLELPGGLKTLHTLANVPKSWPSRSVDLANNWKDCLKGIAWRSR